MDLIILTFSLTSIKFMNYDKPEIYFNYQLILIFSMIILIMSFVWKNKFCIRD